MEVSMQKTAYMVLAFLALVSILCAVPRNLVVVEVGTGTWCGYCPGAAMGCHDLLENGHAVAIIKNHNGDPYANTYSNARNSFYGITGYPTANFDGQNPSVGGSGTQSMYSNYLPKVNSRLAVPSHFNLSATGSTNNGQMNLEVTVSKPEDDTNTNIKLHVVITETDIPQVWFNQTHVDNVNRLMLPDQNGTAISLATGGSSTHNFSFTPGATWNIGKLELVIFLQNMTTKEILQGKKYSLPGLTGALPVNTTTLNFPEAYVTGSSTMNFTITNFFDSAATGAITSNNPVFTVNPSTFNIAGGQNQAFTVTFAPTAAQNYTGTLTINSNLVNHPSITVNLAGTGFINNAPVAQNVTISGPPVIHQYLSSSYTFYDADENTEGSTTIQWYRVVGGQNQAITNATLAQYKTTPEDLTYAIVCGITPRDQHGMAGATAYSTPIGPIEPLPAPQNFTAQETDPGTVVCNWQRPLHFQGRGFVGYRVYRNGLTVSTITNPNNTTFTDTWLLDGTYTYYVVSLFNDPMMVSAPSNEVTVIIGESSNDEDVAQVIHSITASPNPFNSVTSFAIRGKANDQVSINIFNIKGQIVKSLSTNLDQNGNAGLNWNAIDNAGNNLPNGIYFYRMTSSEKQFSGRLILAR